MCAYVYMYVCVCVGFKPKLHLCTRIACRLTANRLEWSRFEIKISCLNGTAKNEGMKKEKQWL